MKKFRLTAFITVYLVGVAIQVVLVGLTAEWGITDPPLPNIMALPLVTAQIALLMTSGSWWRSAAEKIAGAGPGEQP